MMEIPNRLNVILLTIDALRSDTMAGFGGSGEHTPNLDRWARQSLRFTQAISGGSWTQAAFPVILTSSYAGQYGGCLGALSPNRPSPVSALADCGYQTIGISSNPWLTKRRNYHRGFSTFNFLRPVWASNRLRKVRGGQVLLRNPLFHRLSGALGNRLAPPKVYTTAPEINAVILRELEDKLDKPFFLWAHYMDTHWPYHLHHELVDPDEIAQAWSDIATFHAESRNGFTQASAYLDRYRVLYHRALKYLDLHLGILLETLEAMGIFEDTALIVLADHGEEFMDHGQLGHFENNFFDEILRVPFFIHLPGGRDLGEVSKQISLLDVMPTVLQLCGCPLPRNLKGQSLDSFWQGERKHTNARYVISERPRPGEGMIAVRTERYKYIWSMNNPDQPGLYEHASDPRETTNLARQMPELEMQMRAIVKDHLQLIAETDERSETITGDILEERLRDLGYLK